MKVNFSKIKILDIEGKEAKTSDIHKSIARIIYNRTQNLDLVEVAMNINKGKEVELRDSEIKEIKRLVNDKQSGLLAFARKAAMDFLDGLVSKELQ